MKRYMAVGAMALALLAGGCVREVNEYAAELRNAAVLNQGGDQRYTGSANTATPSRQGLGYDTCVWVVDQLTERHIAESACRVHRGWRVGDHGYVTP